MKNLLGFILGTGWGQIADSIEVEKEESFESLFKRKPTVPGHSGKAIWGKLNGKEIIILSGRFHTYEGYSAYEATETIRFLHKQDVKKVIITSACGGLNPKYKVGDVVILNDLISLFCQSPLTGPHFQDMSSPFSENLQNTAIKSAIETKLSFQRGVYAYIKGPHFETFSDKMALRYLGADIVGMSTVAETIMANHLGMEVLGLSLVTNLAFVKHSHEDVLDAARNQENLLYNFISHLIEKI